MEKNILILSILIIINFLIIQYQNKLINLFNIYDTPDLKRKWHEKKISLFGGTIILINFISFCFFVFILNIQPLFNYIFPYLLIGSLFFYFFGLVDDKKELNSNFKFIIEALVVFILVFFDKNLLIEKIYIHSLGIDLNLGKYSYIFSVLSIIIFINALNMFDGINLQAGSYCLIFLITLLFYSELNFLILSTIISLIFFLYLNSKSRLFLGDNGTYLLSFIISYLTISTAKQSDYILFSADKIFLLMILPGLDLIRLFIIRLLNKKHPFSPDRSHIHHILLRKTGFKLTILYIIIFTSLANLSIYFFGDYSIIAIIIFSSIYLITIYGWKK